MAIKKLAFAQIVKVDEAKKEVWGCATQETPDCSGEIFDYETSKPYFKAWSDHASEITDGKSLGNLRYMHQLDAVGKLIAIDFDDAQKKINIGTKIVDESVWAKVVEGVLAGFSIGGSYIKTWREKGSEFLKFTAKPSEISVVDLPCCPVATFEFVKADGSVAHMAFKESAVSKAGKTKRVDGEDLTSSDFIIVIDPDDPETWKLPWKFSTEEKTVSHLRNALARFNQMTDVSGDVKSKAYEKLKRLASEHGIEVSDSDKVLEALMYKFEQSQEIREALSLFAKADRKFQVQIVKSMYDVADLACLLVQIRNIQSYQRWEADMEGEDQDNYAIAEALGRWLADGVEILKDLVDEETQELTAA